MKDYQEKQVNTCTLIHNHICRCGYSVYVSPDIRRCYPWHTALPKRDKWRSREIYDKCVFRETAMLRSWVEQ